MEDLKFTCPICGSNDFGLVQNGITGYRRILGVSADGEVAWDNMDYDFDSTDDFSYECFHCDYTIEDVYDEDDLIEWLKNHNGNHHKRESE